MKESGRTSLAWAWLGAATRRGEWVALVDTFDRFDPASGADCGIVLDGYADVKVGDVLEFFSTRQVEQTLN